MKRSVLILLFLLTIVSINLVFAANTNNENLPSTCEKGLCKPNNNYDSSKPTNAGKVMGLENANEVILEKGDGAIIEKETREIDLLKAQKVTIKGLEYNLPEKAKVKFVKESGIEKVKITLPDGTVLEDPKTVDKELAKDAVFEIKAETGSIKLGKDSFDGTLSYETDKDGNLHKYVKDEKYNLGGLAVTQKKEEKTEVFSDGDLHPEAKEAYLSLGDKTLVIGKNNEGKGPEIKFEPGNRFLEKITSEQQVVMSAGRDADNKNNAGTGAIKITNRGENAPEVVTDKNFRIENGKIIVKTGKTARGTDGIFVDSLKTDDGKKSYSMEIADERWKYKDGGNGKLVIDGNNQAMDDRLDKEPILLSTDLSKGEYQGTAIRINLGGWGQTSNVVVNSPTKGLKIGHFGSSDNKDPLTDVREHYNAIVGEARRRTGINFPNFETYGDVHEGTHGLNSILRNLNGGNVNAFYLLRGDYVILTEPPGVTIAQTAEYVPNGMKSLSSYQTYLVDQRAYWNNQPLNILDETTAYANSETYKRAWKGNDNVVDYTSDFIVYSTALGLAIEQNNPNYWNSQYGAEFKKYFAKNIERTREVNPSALYGNYGGNIITSSDPKYAQLRGFLQRNYPESWIMDNFLPPKKVLQ